MDFSQEELTQIVKIFKDETEEHLSIIDKCLLELEKCPDNLSIIAELFREAHSIKGSARMVNIVAIQDLAHKMEDLLGFAKDGTILINSDIIDVLYQAIDCIGESVKKLDVNNLEVDNEKSQLMVDKIINLQNNLLQKGKANTNNKTDISDNNTQQVKPDNVYSKSKTTIGILDNLLLTIPDLITLFQKKEFEKFIDKLYVLGNLIGGLNNKKLSHQILNIINICENITPEELVNSVCYEEIDNDLVNFVSSVNTLSVNFGLEPVKIQSHINIKSETSSGLNENYDNELFSQIELIFHYLNYIDNKFQNEKSSAEICNSLEYLLKNINNSDVYDVLDIILGIFEYIKKQTIIPNKEVVENLKEALHIVFSKLKNENTAESLSLVKQRLIVLKQMLEIQKNMPDIPKTSSNHLLDLSDKIEYNLPIPKPTKQFQDNSMEALETQAFKTLRVDTKKLDKLENQTEELIVVKIKNRQHSADLNEIMRKIGEIQKDMNKSHAYLKYMDRKSLSAMMNVERFTALRNFQMHIEKINSKIHDLSLDIIEFQKKLVNDDVRLNFLVDAIETMVKSIRVLPLATIFHMFPRMVRDIARQKQKQVDIIILGSETSADKTIIEEIKAPLMHIIRNSIDHGIELPEERIALGKNPTGKIILNSYCVDNAIVIDISDDGGGLDLDKIKQRILEKELLTQDELNQLTPSQIMNIIFWPGFTTGDNVTDISGRGVGLDVVHTKISQLDGKVTIKSKQGEGFKITIKIPITLATLNSFIFKIENQNYAIASSYVKSAIRLQDDKIYTKEGKPHILYNNSSIKLINLAKLLKINTKIPMVKNYHHILIVQLEDTPVAIEVDEFVRTEEILQKKLNPPFTKFKNIMGIASLSNGESCLILNVSDITNSTISNSVNIQNNETVLSSSPEIKRKSILIVDDSITTITLERNILRSAGYNIYQASNGEDAYLIMKKEKIDLLITDIEMPDLDGVELIKKMKNEKINIPIIVLTSITDEKRTSGCLENGAQMLISKKNFDEILFLQSIKKILSKDY